MDVICDFGTDGGPWTIIQQRGAGDENFFRNWTSYESGFGSVESESDTDYWIGLRSIASLTKLSNYQLRIELKKWNGEKRVASYKQFRIDDGSNHYKLYVSGYHGNAGRFWSFHWIGSR